MSDTFTRLARRVAMSLGLGRQLSDTDNRQSTPTLQVALAAGELRSDVPLVQEYGFASRPVPGSDIVVVFQGGDRSRGVAIASGDQRNRPKDLQPGDVCLYHPRTGSRIWLKNDGSIALMPQNGQVVVEGTLTASDDVVANGVSLVNHLTTGVQKGIETSGPPESSEE